MNPKGSQVYPQEMGFTLQKTNLAMEIHFFQ